MKQIIKHFDKAVAYRIAGIPASFNHSLTVATRFGSELVCAPIAVLFAYGLWSGHIISNWPHGRYAGALLIGFLPLGFILKTLTRRKRPDTIYVRSMRFKHFSFPSGHAYGSFLTYGFIAILAGGLATYLLAGVIIAMVGVSRVYLGAHFASDVVGGWVLAATALAVVVGYANHL